MIRSFSTILLFEFGLGIVALLWLYGTGKSAPEFHFHIAAARDFAIYGLPLFGFAAFVTSEWGLRVPGFRRIFEALAGSFLGELIENLSLWRLALLSLSAGLGEELLFRAGVQPYSACGRRLLFLA
ncbi:MAG: hypothetical protein R3B54_19110 [Bdellovibrionota bacterium]